MHTPNRGWWPGVILWRVVIVLLALALVWFFITFVLALTGWGLRFNPERTNRAAGQELPTAIMTVAAASTTVPPPPQPCPELFAKKPQIRIRGNENSGTIRQDIGCMSITTRADAIVTSDPSGLYKKPLDPPSALHQFDLPQMAPTPSVDSSTGHGLLDGLSGPPRRLDGGSPGLNLCHQHTSISEFGADIVTYDVTTYFNIQPFANLTDWTWVSALDVTAYGSVAQWRRDSSNGILIPAGFFSPGIVSVLWQQASGSVKFPINDPFLVKHTMTLNEFINSPVDAQPLCDYEWTLDTETAADPIVTVARYVAEWCGDHYWICFGSSVQCWFLCGF